MGLDDVSKQLARLWAETAENGVEARRRYQELAAADTESHEKESGEAGGAVRSNGVAVGKKPGATRGKRGRAKKAAKRAKGPRALSGYMVFCQVKRMQKSMALGKTTKILADNCKYCYQSKYHEQAAEKMEKLLDSSTNNATAVA